MSTLIYGFGAVVSVVGALMIAFGIPVNEFSFGNTLITAGVTAVVGGLVIIALGVVSSQLQRLNDALGDRAPRPARPLVEAEDIARNIPARVPFPTKPKAEAEPLEADMPEPQVEPVHADSVPEEPANAASFAPLLRNPDEQPVAVEDDVSLLPPHPLAGTPPNRPLPPLQFESMWPEPPASNRPGGAGVNQAAAPPPRRFQQEAAAQRTAPEPSGIAILKSGVVDGMGYTLYVDGSIEAELPQGTLRFASINELRAHLEKNA